MHSRTEWPARISACRKAQARKQSRREKSRVSMAREGYRLWFCKCNDFNLHGVFSRDRFDFACTHFVLATSLGSSANAHRATLSQSWHTPASITYCVKQTGQKLSERGFSGCGGSRRDFMSTFCRARNSEIG